MGVEADSELLIEIILCKVLSYKLPIIFQSLFADEETETQKRYVIYLYVTH